MALVAAGDPLQAMEDVLRIPTDLDLRRELGVALGALILVGVVLPRGRRRLAAWPLGCLLLAPLPYAIKLLFPESVDAPAAAVLG